MAMVVDGFDCGSVAQVVGRADSAMVSGQVCSMVSQVMCAVVAEVVPWLVTQVMCATDCGTEAEMVAETVLGTKTQTPAPMLGGVPGTAQVGTGARNKQAALFAVGSLWVGGRPVYSVRTIFRTACACACASLTKYTPGASARTSFAPG